MVTDYMFDLYGYYKMSYSLGEQIELIIPENNTSIVLKTPTITAWLIADRKNYVTLTWVEIDDRKTITTSNYSCKNTYQVSKKIEKHFQNNMEIIYKIEGLY